MGPVWSVNPDVVAFGFDPVDVIDFDEDDATVSFSDKIRNARGAGPLNPPETTFRQSGPTPIYKVAGPRVVRFGARFTF